MSKFSASTEYAANSDYKLLPLTFNCLAGDEYVVTNLVGESLLVSRDELQKIVLHEIDTNSDIFAKARAHHLVYFENEKSPLELLALKYRTRTQHLKNFTSLHMMVVSLRCDHSCPYCQVSRRSEDKSLYDMSEETAQKALNFIFQSPSKFIKIEFQGGEPLLNFDLIKFVVVDAKQRSEVLNKNVTFVIATTMSMLTDEMLDFCVLHKVDISTSLDGTEDLHNANRPRPGKDSYERFLHGLNRARDRIGRDRVSALMTTTKKSLSRVKEIIDEYIALGFSEIFLRPLSPYGFAMKTKAYDSYEVEEWLSFYKEGLSYILELNKKGETIKEVYTSIILQKMSSMNSTGYVDLMSPAGIGIAAVIYNYDGSVYASDESRMLAEMGNKKFKLGDLNHNTYEEIFGSEELIDTISQSMTISSPMCYECAYEPYCGSDPVFHYGMYGDVVGRKPESSFCNRNMSIFKHIFELRKDKQINRILEDWV